MIYYYTVRLAYWKNDKRILVDYKVSFSEIIDFLYEKQKKYSSLKVYWIKPYYRIDKRFNF